MDNITIPGQEPITLDAMNSARLMMAWTTSSRRLRSLNAMNSLGVLMTWTTSSHVLKALDAMNSSSMWMVCATPSRELKAMDALNNLTLWMIWMTRDPVSSSLYNISGLWMIWMTLCNELRVVDNMNDSKSLAHDLWCYEYLKVVVYMNEFGLWA